MAKYSNPVAVQVQSVAHVNVNCSDMVRSLAFYQEHLGLASAAHTAPEKPQDGSGFGLPGRVQWDAHMLCDARGIAGPAIDLLEWKTPAPVGRPYTEPSHLGFFRICFLARDLDARFEALRSRGVACLGEPQELPLGAAGVDTVKVLCFRDPDGTTLELAEVPVESDRIAHVNVNCSDIERSAEWYERVLGLKAFGSSSPGPVPGAAFGIAGEVEWDARFLLPEGLGIEDTMAIDLLEWRRPAPVGAPYPQGHHLGLYRMAFLVADVHAARDELLRLGVDAPAPVWLDMGPEIPVDGVEALFFPDPDGACLELIQVPTVTAP
jgi:catechol 2,3-dioxygenase-like lactoylglutathione lyase family enzyme